MAKKEDPRFQGRPRIGKDAGFKYNVNRQGRKQKVGSVSEEFDQMLLERGWRECSLDTITPDAPIQDTVLMFRYRGGFGDMITALPGIENVAKKWDHAHIAVAPAFQFLYRHIKNAEIFDYHDMFGMKKEEELYTTKYLEVCDRYLLSIDMFCPAGAHEQLSKFRPTMSRIDCFDWVLDGPPRQPYIPESNYGGKESVADLEVPSMGSTLREWSKGVLQGDYRGMVGVQIQSENVSKDWAISNYRKLCEALLRNNVLPVVFHPSMVIGDYPHFVNQTLENVTAALSFMDVVVGPDSGLLHAGAALGKPTIWLFGPTNGPLTIKYYKDAKVLQSYDGLRCHTPCYYSREMNGYYCIDRYGDCMSQITVARVYKAIQDSLVRLGC